MVKKPQWFSFLVLLTLLTSCGVLLKSSLDEQFGDLRVHERVVPRSSDVINYDDDIKPIFESRCMSCHGCYDAPCQLKLSSFEGLDRGANKNIVYNGSRLTEAPLTRLFKDAESTQEWRGKDFFAVLNEREQTPKASLEASLLYQSLVLKKTHPLPKDTPILPDSFDFSLNRAQVCPKIEEFDAYKKNYPLWGMPYGLPQLEDSEVETVKQWLQEGAKVLNQEKPSVALTNTIDKWELFLNGNSNKERLVSRYIYEHLYLANLFFSEITPVGESEIKYFRLVRSATPSGQPVEIINTRRPFDDPEVDRVYYRFLPWHASITVKTHLPYQLDSKRLRNWQNLFFEQNYEVATLPGYKPEEAANPFVTFEQLPVKSRYIFMLEEAQFTIGGFIKGSVCRGQVALNVIDDHFWVMFVDPDAIDSKKMSDFLQKNSQYLRLPAEEGSNKLINHWYRFSKLQKHYQQERFDALKEVSLTDKKDLRYIWNGGESYNTNAALTIFRHFDSATIIKGHKGAIPKTAWIIDYPLLERIHYLLVAGFDVYGNVNHQLTTRLYMDFLRMEGEFNFLNFLSAGEAKKELAFWNRGVEKEVKEYLKVFDYKKEKGIESSERVVTKKDFLHLVHQHLGPVVNADEINRPTNKANDTLHYFQKIAEQQGSHLALFPEQTIIRVHKPNEEDEVYSLLLNVGHTNIAHLFRESKRILPEENTVSLLKGIVGAYPNSFLSVNEKNLSEFSKRLVRIKTEEDYREFKDTYGIRRTSNHFWDYSDWLHHWYRQNNPLEGGILDYSRLENR